MVSNFENKGRKSIIHNKKVYSCKKGDTMNTKNVCVSENGMTYRPLCRSCPWSVVAFFSFLGVIIVNALANVLPIGGNMTGDISDNYPNLFAPTGFTFGIWILIYALLGGYSILEIIKSRELNLHQGFNRTLISQLFFLSNLFNMGWIFAWHYNRIGISLLLMIGLFVSLILIYINVNTESKGLYETKDLATRIPFSVYLGWISVALVANITTYLVSIDWDNWFGWSDSVWTVVILIVITFIGIFMMSIKGDVAYVSVLFWAFIGILVKRYNNEQDPWVMTAVIFGMVFLGFELFYGSYRNAKKMKMICN